MVDGTLIRARAKRLSVALAAILLAVLLPVVAFANAITVENALPGNPSSEWDVSGIGDASIQGFATDISVNPGETVHFKIKTNAANYHVEIYRIGYYQGNGARHVATAVITATLPQIQPADLYDSNTGLTDCGNWGESAHWDVPAGAVSGIYLAKLIRDDTQGASHIAFVVRNDASHSDMVFKTSDATWQAYNVYGGNSLYVGSVAGFPSGHAPKVSYNRPFITRGGGGGGGASEDWLFNAEYPMVRWLEANGYDVTYTTSVDADRHGDLLPNHRVFLSVGHDEYWSQGARASVEAARDAGTHLAFFSGNEIYWKTRWEPSIDGSGTPYRTLVCYKEGTLGENACGGKCDPLPDTWTGLWRDGCAFTPPADGCRPENALSGQISWDGTTGTLRVGDASKNLRFWRNTAVANLGAGQSLDLTPGTLGYEWDWQQYAASYPTGRVQLSTTTFDGHTHHLSLYRAASGALVFGAGTVQWAWGLDSHHDRGSDAPSLAMEQATVNVLAEMGSQPASLQTSAGLTAATATGDVTPPASAIGFPAAGASLPANSTVTITGTATDAGLVAGVEVSVDGGATWSPALGTTSWSFGWTPVTTGSVTIMSRGYDDLGNLETATTASNAVTVSVTPAQSTCPCTIFATNAPTGAAVSDGQPIELGVKFRSNVDGNITGVRFYKGAGNGGTHIGHLWSKTGTMLAEATFSSETSEGWQTVSFGSPVAITAGTTYVASYHSESFFSDDTQYFTAAHTNGPLTAIANADPDGGNGVYVYSATSAFPSNSPGTGPFGEPNYWVDVVFDIPGGADQTPPTVTTTTPGNNGTGVATNAAIVAGFSEALDPATVTTATFELRDPSNAPVVAAVSYDAPSHTATLTPGTLLAASTVYTARLAGGASGSRIQDVAGNALAADYTWAFTTAAPDLTPPNVTSTTPAASAGGVTPNATVNADFDEALTPSSVSTATFELRDAGNALVPATVTYNVYTHTATLTPAAALASGSYTARVIGGATDPRVKDLAGNALAADVTWTFTVSGFNCPCTIWSPSTVPGVVADPDNHAVELGVKFRASADGYVTGVRFYKGATNTGTHVGSLWSSTGTSLANATFTGETTSGWQEVSFGTPVAITAGITYVASYHTNTGHYAQDTNYFTASTTNGPLRALANGEDGPNGVYVYTAAGEGGGVSTFPTETFNASNYWVDPVFATSVGPDVTPPTVVSHVPSSGASGAAVGAPLVATFSEAMDATTVTGSTFELRDAGNALVAANVTYDVPSRSATLTPASALAYSTTYTATLKGGATDPRLKDVAGNAMLGDASWSFTTSAPPPPPPTEGPGGPILVISTAADPFSRYFVEILRAEGLNEFTAMDVSQVTSAVLADYDVVILGQMSLSAAQVTMLTDWTTAGGTLIAMRPDAQLSGLLGITPAGGTLSNQYLLVNTASGPGAGIVSQTMQFHGTADRYTLSGATSLATLYSNATTATANPAVTLRSVGMNGGQAVAFAYDLARSIVYTRQGNPAWAGQKRDGQIEPIRSDDLYFGNASFDPQPDWVDLNKVAIPQADEQQRLLANVITLGNLHRKPLPRFWYLPKGLKAAIVMTGDDHGDGGMAPRFDIYRTQSPAGCSLDDWECVRATGYEYVGGGFTNAQAVFYNGLGFEVAVHINTNCARATPEQYESFVSSQLATFGSAFPGIPLPTSNRNHCIAWSDWSSVAEIEAAHGIRLDTNYYYWPSAWIQNRSGMFTGSGIPMRFAKSDGTIIDCFQASTEMPDESGESFPSFCDQLLDKANGPEGYYGVFTTNMHFDTSPHPGSDAVVASAQARGVPVVSAKQMLTWLDGRNGSSFGGLTWSGHTLSFSIATASGSRNLKAMLPTVASVGQLTGITLGGTPIAYTTQTIKGIGYAFFSADPGSYVATYQVDETPPLITGASSTVNQDGTATVMWTTNETSDSHVDYGTAPDALTLTASDAGLVTSHSLVLGTLSSNTTYYYRVRSADAAGNSATEPPTSSAPLSFATPGPVCALDETAAQFALGTTGANTFITQFADGEVTLAPSTAQEFGGTTLPAGWTSATWNAGGAVTVAGGSLTVDGAHASSNASFGPGSSLEFVATYQSASFQNVGFSTDAGFNSPWVVIGMGSSTTNGVYARTSAGTEQLLSTTTLGAPHRYRIDWNAGSFVFWIDGVQAGTLNFTVASNMVAMVSDFNTGGGTVSVDWIHASPYAASGSFSSRVFDTNATAQWGVANWTADTPSGTSVALFVRKGDTPTPDGTWTAFAQVSSGGTVGGASRYLQYRADLATTNTATTPVLRDVHVSCNVGSDVTPPVVSNVSATPGGDGVSAQITWTTDEAADSRVDYGATQGTLDQNVSDAARVASHMLVLSGLSSNTTYYYRVRSVDASGNATTEPPTSSSPLSFTTSALTCLLDDTAADFGAGTPGSGTTVAQSANGEVILKPSASADFSVMPPTSEWQGFAWSAGGAVSVSGGQLSVDGMRFNTEPTTTTYGPGSSIEFVATFQAAAFEHIGFANGTDAVATGGMFNTFPMLAFSTGSNGTAVITRVFPEGGGSFVDFTIPQNLIGTPHRYRIDWKSASLDFSVDGSLVHTEPITLTTPMRAAASDLTPGGPALQMDWIRVTPYASSGSFVSRVVDAGTSTNWGAMSWTSTVPAGGSLQMLAREGNTATPDASWTPFVSVSTSGATVGGGSRYLQYRADLATTDLTQTPTLASVQVSCGAGADLTPPAITNVTATPGNTSATVGWNTNELATSRVDYGTTSGALTLNVSSTSLTGTHSLGLSGLTAATTYYYRVTSIDGSGNSTTEPAAPSAPLSFTTLAPPCANDITTTDFSAGTPGGATYVSQTTDGEVILKPAEGAEFTGAALPAGWSSTLYSGGGTAVVSGGHVSVDGAYVAPATFYGPGRSLEFVATFDAASAGQHAGFGNDLNGAPWAIFSTHAGGVLEARTNPGTETNQLITGVTLGVPHRFRVDWSSTQVVYSVDGAVVATHAVAIAANMRPIVADGPVGGTPLQADWVRMTPYTASGSYVSRVFDGGGPTTWGIASWSSSLPANTSLAMFQRHGNTPVPDGTWSAFAIVPASGADLAAAGRFLQYRADLATTDPTTTPALLDVAIACTSTIDQTPPVLTAVTATPAAGGTAATITWTTDELANSRVDFGTSSGSLTSNLQDPSFVVSHSLSLTSLQPSTTYFFRATSADLSANSATSPVAPATLSFTTAAAPCPTDATASDFGLGTLDANTTTSLEGDGEVILKPATLSNEFSGATVPADWHAHLYANGGTAVVGGGKVTVDGANTSANTTFGPGRSLEFVATYSAATFQNIGISSDSLFNVNTWVTIGEGGTADGIYARTSTNVSTLLLPSSQFGTPHRFRIDWNPTNFVFYVDGAQLTTITMTMAGPGYAMISDVNVGGGVLSVDWLRVTPYAASGSFTSRVFDGLGPTTWGATTWTSSTPSGTSLSIFARTGNTPAPDGTWSAYDLLTNGASIGSNSRYVQYRADLTSTSPSYATPVLKDVAIACVAGPDLNPPVITNVLATTTTNGQGATVTWTTDERASSRVDYGTDPSNLNLSVTDATALRSHSLSLTGLTPGGTYYYRVRSTDAAGNQASSPNPPSSLSFTTPLVPCLVDNTDADFGAGTQSGTAVSLVTDGEVILAPTLGVEFSGSTLPANWTLVSWSSGGTAPVSGGKVTVDGGRLTSPLATGYTSGRVLEFVATFGAATFQNAGFGAGDNTTGATGMFATGAKGWAMFGTASTTTISARLNTGSASSDVVLTGLSLIGTAHRYRIEWRADSVIFSVDGASVNRRAFVLLNDTTMRPGISDFTVGGANVSVDWMRVTPYAASGTFTSRVYDAGALSSWGTMSWTADVPAGTSLTMSARKGNTPVPDGSWSAFATVSTSGGVVGGLGRYIQYSAALGANAALNQTPALRDVGISCGACNAAVPTAIADLAAVRAGNNSGGRQNVRVNWSGVGSGQTVAIYRKSYGDYPLYRAGQGAVPTAPASPTAAVSQGWALTSVSASGGLDAPATRGFWYYVAFVTNACGVASGPSNVSSGALDYVLGDVSNGIAVCASGGEAGDGIVNTPDLSALGGSYGQSFPTTDDRVCFDVGPTVDGNPVSRPTPDGRLDFEDLVLYALNFNVTPAATGSAPRAAARPASAYDELRTIGPASVKAGESFDVALRFQGTGQVHAVSAQLDWDASLATVTGFDAGDLLAAANGVVLSPRPGAVDAAVLGVEGPGLMGEGNLVIVHFRALGDGDPRVRLAGSRARDGANRPVTFGQTGTPAPTIVYATGIGPVFPNPFRSALSVSFALAREARVKLIVFDLAGRAVRHLEEGDRAAGIHLATWDGRDDAGVQAAAGLYVVRFETGEVRQNRRVMLIR